MFRDENRKSRSRNLFLFTCELYDRIIVQGIDIGIREDSEWKC